MLSYFLQPTNATQFTLVRRGDNSTQLELAVEPNRTYVIRASTDLKTWENIATVSSADGTVRFSDVNAPTARVRFYWAVAQ